MDNELNEGSVAHAEETIDALHSLCQDISIDIKLAFMDVENLRAENERLKTENEQLKAARGQFSNGEIRYRYTLTTRETETFKEEIIKQLSRHYDKGVKGMSPAVLYSRSRALQGCGSATELNKVLIEMEKEGNITKTITSHTPLGVYSLANPEEIDHQEKDELKQKDAVLKHLAKLLYAIVRLEKGSKSSEEKIHELYEYLRPYTGLEARYVKYPEFECYGIFPD